MEAWERYAREHGLRWRGRSGLIGSELSGTVDGLRLRAVVCEPPPSRSSKPTELLLLVKLRASLPPDLELLYNHQLVPVDYTLLAPTLEPWGKGLMVQREHHAWLKEMLRDVETLTAVGSFLHRTSGRIHFGGLEAYFPGMPDPEAVIAEAVAVAGRIQAAWESSWRALAEELGLRFSPVNQHGQWKLLGTWRGMKVTVRYTRQEISFHARIRDVPGELSIFAEDRSGMRTGNPILDQLLYVQIAHPCLKDPDLAGALMAALHPHPGASFDASGLRIPAAADADVRELLLLAEAVQAAMP